LLDRSDDREDVIVDPREGGLRKLKNLHTELLAQLCVGISIYTSHQKHISYCTKLRVLGHDQHGSARRPKKGKRKDKTKCAKNKWKEETYPISSDICSFRKSLDQSIYSHFDLRQAREHLKDSWTTIWRNSSPQQGSWSIANRTPPTPSPPHITDRPLTDFIETDSQTFTQHESH